MQVQVNIEFDQLLRIVRALPSGQLKKLRAEIEKETEDKKTKNDLEELLLNGPTATKKQLEIIAQKQKGYQPMANNIVMVDTSILIDYYRKSDKENSVWVSLVRQGYSFVISSITKYEIYSGATHSQLAFWDKVLETVEVIPFDEAAVNIAVEINADLKLKRKQIDLPDLFIAATALTYSLPLATLNRKHFERIGRLNVV